MSKGVFWKFTLLTVGVAAAANAASIQDEKSKSIFEIFNQKWRRQTGDIRTETKDHT